VRRPLYLGELLWKPREDDTRPEWREYRNFWRTTDAADGTHVRQSAGINPISRPRQRRRRPAVAIFITPAGEGHRLPWLDEVDTDAGFVRYFGDNKPESGKQAEAVAGNAALLDEMSLYGAEERATREQAAPLLFFENVGSAEGRPLTRFIGFGVIELAHRVTQLFKGHTFTNYAFDCVLFRGVDDVDGREALDFGWIDDRRDAGLTDVEANTAAPDSWQVWLETGATGLAHRRAVGSSFARMFLRTKTRSPLGIRGSGECLSRCTSDMRVNTSTGFRLSPRALRNSFSANQGFLTLKGGLRP
jgi:hypothetical protein